MENLKNNMLGYFPGVEAMIKEKNHKVDYHFGNSYVNLEFSDNVLEFSKNLYQAKKILIGPPYSGYEYIAIAAYIALRNVGKVVKIAEYDMVIETMVYMLAGPLTPQGGKPKDFFRKDNPELIKILGSLASYDTAGNFNDTYKSLQPPAWVAVTDAILLGAVPLINGGKITAHQSQVDRLIEAGYELVFLDIPSEEEYLEVFHFMSKKIGLHSNWAKQNDIDAFAVDRYHAAYENLKKSCSGSINYKELMLF